MSKSNNFYILINLITLVGVLVVNALANLMPINGITTGEVSDQYESLITPSGFTFSIWGLIYLGLMSFSGYSMTLFSLSKKTFLIEIGHGVWISNFLNICWILAWHHHYIGLSLFIMLLLLVSLITINLRILGFRKKIKNRELYMWFVRIPYGLYLGWILVATFANFSAYMVSIDWNHSGILPEFWLAISLFSLTLTAIMAIRWFRLVVTAMAIAWGMTGILVNLYYKKEDELLIYVGALLTLVIWVYSIIGFNKYILKR
jgi:benzodiazapine receptor